MGELVQSLVAQSGESGGITQMLVFLVPMLVIMYFLMIRPERKKQQEAQNLMASLKKGDEVVLTSGIVGKIQAVEDKLIVLEIADKTRIRVLKMAVSGPATRFLTAPDARAEGKTEAKGELKAGDAKSADDKPTEKPAEKKTA